MILLKDKDVSIRAGLLLANISTDIKEKYTINFLKERTVNDEYDIPTI